MYCKLVEHVWGLSYFQMIKSNEIYPYNPCDIEVLSLINSET